VFFQQKVGDLLEIDLSRFRQVCHKFFADLSATSLRLVCDLLKNVGDLVGNVF